MTMAPKLNPAPIHDEILLMQDGKSVINPVWAKWFDDLHYSLSTLNVTGRGSVPGRTINFLGLRSEEVV